MRKRDCDHGGEGGEEERGEEEEKGQQEAEQELGGRGHRGVNEHPRTMFLRKLQDLPQPRFQVESFGAIKSGKQKSLTWMSLSQEEQWSGGRKIGRGGVRWHWRGGQDRENRGGD